MNKVLTLISLGVFLWQLAHNYGKSSQIATQSFSQWCQNRNSVPEDTQRTIDILLKQAGTESCQLADSNLKNLTELNLSNEDIVDLQPLASLTNLTTINLSQTQTFLPPGSIVDLQPLAHLTNLTELYLFHNQIVDVQPLARLTNLNTLGLGRNKISNITPLDRKSVV